MTERTPALLVLEDGSAYTGISLEAEGEWVGQVVFNTSITGYQEIISDPACWGQMVVFTNPHIGNAGVNPADMESARPQVRAVLARKICQRPSNWRSTGALPALLRAHRVPAIEGLDTRGLTLLLRRTGPLCGALSTQSLDRERLLQLARSAPALDTLAAQREAAARARNTWSTPLDALWLAEMKEHLAAGAPGARVVVVDCGGRQNLLRHLALMGAQPVVLPPDATLAQVQAERPQGVIISGGPGHPAEATAALALVRDLVVQHAAAPACRLESDQPTGSNGTGLPLFGIGLGMQLIALALGAQVQPLPAGHRADNVPVLDLATGRIEITAHNHGYAVDPASLARLPLVVTHTNLNDRSIEGLRHAEWPIAGVQFQPEASPGPHDSLHLLYEFITTLTERAPHA